MSLITSAYEPMEDGVPAHENAFVLLPCKIGVTRWTGDCIGNKGSFVVSPKDDKEHPSLSLFDFTVAPPGADFVDPELRASLRHEGSVTGMKFHNPSTLLTSSTSGRLSAYTVDSRSSTLRKSGGVRAHKGVATCVDVNRAGDVFTSGEDGRVFMYSLQDLQQQREIRAHSGSVAAVAAQGQNRFVSVATSGQLRAWDTRSTSNIEMTDSSGSAIHCIAVHPEQNDIIATGASDGGVTIWDMRRPKHPLMQTTEHQGDNIWEIHFYPTASDCVLTCADNGTVQLYDFNAQRDPSRTGFAVDESNFTITPVLEQSMPVNSVHAAPELQAVVAGTDAGALCFSMRFNPRR